VLIVDTSASMSTVDPEGPRMTQARAAARRIMDELPVGGRITVLAADDTAHVLVSETDDRAAALAAIDGIQGTQVPGNLTDAFALASALAARDSDSSVVVVTDANSDRLPRLGIGAQIRVERVGSTDANQAVAALSAVRRSGGAQLDTFVAVSNPSAVDVTRRVEIYADGALVDARDLAISAGQRAEAIVTTVPAAATLIEARLAGSDALAEDDRAFALVPQAGAVGFDEWQARWKQTVADYEQKAKPYVDDMIQSLKKLVESMSSAAVVAARWETAAVAMSPPHVSSRVTVIPSLTARSRMCRAAESPPSRPILRFADPACPISLAATSEAASSTLSSATSGRLVTARTRPLSWSVRHGCSM